MTQNTPHPADNLKDHLANERTFLAWMRTSIGIMAFGFVVEKFALFMKQIALLLVSHGIEESQNLFSKEPSSSPIFGISLVGVGALIALFSFVSYKKTERQIENSTYRYSSTLATIVTVLVVVIGIFLVLYLVTAE